VAVRRCEQVARDAEAAERIGQAGGGAVSFWKAALPLPLYEGALAAADELCVDFGDGGSHQPPSALMLCCESHAKQAAEEESGVGVNGLSDEGERRDAVEPLVKLLRSLAEATDADESEQAESESEGEVDADGGDGSHASVTKMVGGESDDEHESSRGPPPSDYELLAGARSLLPSFQGRALFLQCARFERVPPPDANCRLVFDGPGLTARVVTTRAVRAGEQLTLPGDDG
jgi:hypothetical protein